MAQLAVQLEFRGAVVGQLDEFFRGRHDVILPRVRRANVTRTTEDARSYGRSHFFVVFVAFVTKPETPCVSVPPCLRVKPVSSLTSDASSHYRLKPRLRA